MKDKTSLFLSLLLAISSAFSLVVMALTCDYVAEAWLRVLLIAAATVNFIVCVAVACVLEKHAGDYVCSKCQKRFVPTMKAFVFGAHLGTTRYLRCPHCGEKSFCRKSFEK